MHQMYVIRGHGEALVLDPTPNQWGNVEATMHGGRRVWVGVADLLRPATRADLEAREAQARPRGVACDDTACWCRQQ